MNGSNKTDFNNNSNQQLTKLMVNVGNENFISSTKAALLSKQLNLLNLSQQQQSQQQQLSKEWDVDSSQFAKHTSNPVRKLIEQMRLEPNPALPMIALSIGDPTIFSDLGKPDTVTQAIEACIKDKKFDGYTPSYGSETSRTAIAKYCSRPDDLIYKPSDIILTNGCSQAIDLCIMVLANQGQNILIPKPGFSIYKTLCGTLGINVKYYSLLVSRQLIISYILFFRRLYFKHFVKLKSGLILRILSFYLDSNVSFELLLALK